MSQSVITYDDSHGPPRLLVLGTPRLVFVTDEGHEQVVMGPGKAIALLAYLHRAPRNTATSERLVDLLWGDRSTEAGLRALRQYIWLVRQHAGVDLIRRSGAGVGLAGPLESDLAAFEAAIGDKDLVHAVELYGGDFFAQFASPGATEFEHWAESERIRARRLYVDAAEQVARRALDEGRPRASVELAHRVRCIDPHGETGWRLLLQARVASGDAPTARAEADAFASWLAEHERAGEPSSQSVLAMVRRADREQPGGRSDADVEPELVGREATFSAVCGLWAEASSRGTRRAHISADPGLGKTRLLTDLAARLRSTRERVVFYRANIGERHMAFASAAAIAARLSQLPGARGVSTESARELVALNPALSGTFNCEAAQPQHGEVVRRRGLAVLELVSAVADEKPLALLIDDLHWVDDDSLAIIRLVSGELDTDRVLVVTTGRNHGTDFALADTTRCFALAPLDEVQIAALVESIGGLPAEDWAKELPALLASCSHGSPLLVLEALRLSRESSVLRLDGRRWSCNNARTLHDLLQSEQIIARRLAELADTDRLLLQLAAAAGVPLPITLLADAAKLGEKWVTTSCAALDRRGLLMMAGVDVRVAHDEIAAAALAAANPEVVRYLRISLAEVMKNRRDAVWNRRSVEHFLAAGEARRAQSVVINAIRSDPSPGAYADRVRTLLGPGATPAQVAAVCRAIPFRTRHPTGFRMLRVAGAAAALTVILTAGATLDHRRSRADAELLIGAPGRSGAGLVRHITLNASDWNPKAPIEAASFGSGERWTRALAGYDVLRPGTDERATQRAYPNGRGMDVELLGPTGVGERLTDDGSDDIPLAFSPDGEQLVIGTSRWRHDGMRDLGVIDMRTRAVRRLTDAGREQDSHAAWSPDGSRIAFVRMAQDNAQSSLCWVTPNGITFSCARSTSLDATTLAGWIDAERVIACGTVGPSQDNQCEIVNFATGSLDPLPPSLGTVASIDPAGRFVLAQRGQRTGPIQWAVTPIGQWDLRRPIDPADSSHLWRFAWVPDRRSPSAIEQLAIDTLRGPLMKGVPYLLHAVARNHAGVPVPIGALQWTSLTPSLAVLESDGVVLPRDTGLAVVRASAGGWRTVVDTLRIRTDYSREILDERWTDNVERRWRFFGSPLPKIAADPTAGRVFLNDGDGTFFSGAYYLPFLDARRGLAIDADLSEPITADEWQRMEISLNVIRDTATLAKWDRKTGYLPGIGGPGCHWIYPQSEGANSRWTSDPAGDLRRVLGPDAPALGSGRWYHVRIQIFPDGGCGAAINGKPVYVNHREEAASSTITLYVQGSSAGTRIALGKLTITEGVPPDIDWAMGDGQLAAARQRPARVNR
jgi:DNA-binding SARP family transcriptional activator